VPLFRWRASEQTLGETLDTDSVFKRSYYRGGDRKLNTETSGEQERTKSGRDPFYGCANGFNSAAHRHS
jgi:hypothetical protein